MNNQNEAMIVFYWVRKWYGTEKWEGEWKIVSLTLSWLFWMVLISRVSTSLREIGHVIFWWDMFGGVLPNCDIIVRSSLLFVQNHANCLCVTMTLRESSYRLSYIPGDTTQLRWLIGIVVPLLKMRTPAESQT